MIKINKYNKDMKKSSDEIITNARFSENYKYIIDSDGNRVELTDSRIVFVILVPRKPYEKRLVMKSYEMFGANVRISSETNADILRYAKRLCSGRECLPSIAIAGNVIKDLCEHRKENEITTNVTHLMPMVLVNMGHGQLCGMFLLKD